MFEGHDTTAANITFSLWLLARHKDIQRKAQVRESLVNTYSVEATI